MAYRIGLDFGSSTTKIAYLDNQERLQLFRYPGAMGSSAIPTVLTFNLQAGQLSEVALAADLLQVSEQQRNFFACEYIKPFLAQADSKHWRAFGWSLPVSPAVVARVYLQQLLWENPHSFTHEVGPIAGGVLAVPHSWQAPHPVGRKLLQDLFDTSFSLPSMEIRSETVCAATYITYCYQHVAGRPLRGKLLVCDVGGSSCSAALCHTEAQQVDVLAHEGQNSPGLGLAGIAFDREVIATVSTTRRGVWSLTAAEDFHFAVRTFTKLKSQEHENIQRLWALQSKVPELSDTPLYIAPDYTVDANQLRYSFRPIETNLTAVLTRLWTQVEAHGWSVDHVALVGGFARFPLVQAAVRQCLSRLTERQAHAIQYVESAAAGSEVACGAALLAKHLPRTVHYYPHTIGIFAHHREKGVLVETFLPMIESGQVPVGQSGPHFAHGGLHEPLTIHVGHPGATRLPLYVRWRGRGEPQVLPFPEEKHLAPGSYHMGLLVDARQQVSLYCQPVPSGAAQRYQLGPIPYDETESNYGLCSR